MADQIFIQIRFSITQKGQTLQDALIIPQAEYNSLSTDQIQAMKQDRFDTWYTAITTPPDPADQPSITDQLVETVNQMNTLTDTLTQLNQDAIANNTPALPTQEVKDISDKTDTLVAQANVIGGS